MLDQVVAGDELAGGLVVEDGVRRRVPRAVVHAPGAAGEGQQAPSASGVLTVALAPQARNERVTARSAKTTSSGIPWRSMIASAKASSASITSE